MRTEVSSSLLKSIGYDPATRTLELEFKAKKEGEPAKVYRYSDVSPDTYAKFTAAPSLGNHFLKEIKPAHACTRVEEKPDAEGKKKKKSSEGRKPFQTATEGKKKKKSSEGRKPFQTATDDESTPF